MSELQIKMLIVFTGKTGGLKLKEYGVPFILHKWRKYRHFRNESSATTSKMSSADGSNVSSLASRDPAVLGVQHTEGALAMKEEGSRLLDDIFLMEESDGTFDDFGQMVIQFGFLCLVSVIATSHPPPYSHCVYCAYLLQVG